MSLSAGLFGAGCIQQLDRQAGFPPGPPSPFPLPLARAPRACLLSILCHSLPLCLCLSAFLGFCVPTSPGSLPSQLHPSEFPWLSPVTLTLHFLPLFPIAQSLPLHFSRFLCPLLSLSLIPLALASHLLPDPLPFTPGSGHRNRIPEDVEEEPFPSPIPHLFGCSWAAGLGGGEDRVPRKWEGGARGEQGLPRGDPPSAARARPLPGAP